MKIPWLRLGPTGRHPQGAISSADDGELRLALVADYPHRQVRVEFGGPVAWLALPPEEARALAQMLVEMAESVERGQRRRAGE